MVTKEFLEQEYLFKQRTAKSIGKDFGVTDGAVRLWLKKYEIPIRPRGGRGQTVNLKGKTFGEYLVLEQVKGNGHQAIWKCRCSCGTVKDVKSSFLKRGEVKSCGSCLEHYAWKGCGELSGLYWARLKSNAKRRKINFDITIEQGWALFLKQNRQCNLSGQPIWFTRNHTSENKSQTASLDRIDNNKGYTIDNIQWVHKFVNRIKREFDQSEFLMWCKRIAEYQNDSAN